MINGRTWFTTCEAYSQTERCRTDIWATTVTKDSRGRYTVQQRWALEDPRLSVRHMAWSVDGDQRLLGIALQAQHDERQERRNAPMIAVWDGSTLTLPPFPYSVPTP